jgi:hypothetical protein
MTLVGIEPVTFQFVMQYLNHCAIVTHSIVKRYQQFTGTCYLHVGDVTLEVEAPGSPEGCVSKD